MGTSKQKVPGSIPGSIPSADTRESWNQLCTDSKRCVLGKDTLPLFSTPSEESIYRGLVCATRIPSSTDSKDPDAADRDGSQCRLHQHTQHAPKVLSPGWRRSVATLRLYRRFHLTRVR